jgi:hypothetical protein
LFLLTKRLPRDFNLIFSASAGLLGLRKLNFLAQELVIGEKANAAFPREFECQAKCSTEKTKSKWKFAKFDVKENYQKIEIFLSRWPVTNIL